MPVFHPNLLASEIHTKYITNFSFNCTEPITSRTEMLVTITGKLSLSSYSL